MSRTNITVVEIFGATIQGEGAQAGVPTVFVRTGGCDWLCQWCDSLHAVLPEHARKWSHMTPYEVLEEVNRLTNKQPITITLSGGNPALQPFEHFIDLAHAQGHRVVMETQGSRFQTWFRNLDHLILSPKPPSSGMTNDWDVLRACLELQLRKSLKVVVMDEEDYLFAREMSRKFKGEILFLSVGNDNPPHESQTVQHGSGVFDPVSIRQRTEWLIERTVKDGWATQVRILPQVHTLLWGNERAR